MNRDAVITYRAFHGTETCRSKSTGNYSNSSIVNRENEEPAVA